MLQTAQQQDSRQLPMNQPEGHLETVAQFYGAMPTGVAVSSTGRIFVNFPKWGDDVKYTVAEVIDGETVPFPSQTLNTTDPSNLAGTLVSVQSVVIDPLDRLWILDTGSPMFQPTQFGGPKLLCVDLNNNSVVKTILFPQDVALKTSYLNDVRFDLTRKLEGLAYITDSSAQGPNGIIVVDLATGDSWRRLNDHPTTKPESLHEYLPLVEGKPILKRTEDAAEPALGMGADGIAISADGERLYYCPLASRRLYSVATDALCDPLLSEEKVAATVRDEGNKGGGSDGLESDAEGNLYATNYEHNALLRRSPTGQWETIAHDARLLWPDTLAVATDGYIYVTANQLHRQADYQQGRDMRQKPYSLFRVKIDANPVQLS